MLNFRREHRYPFMKEIWNLPGSPVTLDQPPVAINKHGIPSILEVLGLDLHPGLVPDTLRMTFDLFTVQTGVTFERKNTRNRYLKTNHRKQRLCSFLSTILLLSYFVNLWNYNLFFFKIVYVYDAYRQGLTSNTTVLIVWDLPAQSHKQHVISFCSVFNSSKETHWSVCFHGFLEFHYI